MTSRSRWRPTHEPPSTFRAIIELIDGELKIYPLADCDTDEQRILDAFEIRCQGFPAMSQSPTLDAALSYAARTLKYQ